MPRKLTTALLALAAIALLAPGGATAAKRTPKISFVSPMRVAVGADLVIRGRNFSPRRNRNTVIFRAPSGRTAFAKPRRASRRRLVVRVPGAVARLMSRASNGRPVPTRFRLRVLSGRFGRYTSRRLSPVVVPVGFGVGVGPGGGSRGQLPPPGVCGTGSDYDDDLVSNDLELAIKTDPCLKDTDRDGIEDGFEYKSAVDLNDDEYREPNNSLPYPGKRPYPNPLDPSDANTDYDRDVLTQSEEQALWRYTVQNGGPRSLFPLSYSDGEQFSLSTRGPDGRRVPTQGVAGYGKHQDFLNWASGNGYRQVMLENAASWGPPGWNLYGLLDFNRNGVEESGPRAGYRWSEVHYYDHDNDAFVSDDERDEDADGLTNYEETHGRLWTVGWWSSCYTIEAPFAVTYAGTYFIDPDSDGDGVRDGADDQDHDDIPNLLEISRNLASGLDDRKPGTVCQPADGLPQPPATHHAAAYGRVNPFNSCLPATFARTCDRHPGLEGAHAPFDNSPNWYSLN